MHATNKSGSFVSTLVDGGGGIPSIGLGPGGDVRLTYYSGSDGGLKFAGDQGGAWTIVKIPTPNTALAEENSLAVDRNGVSHVSYHLSDFGYDALMYATDGSGAWTSSVIDNNGAQGYANSIAVDNDLHVHVSSYNNNNGTLSYSTNKTGAWVVTRNLANKPIYLASSIATDAGGNAHIGSLYYTGYGSGVMYFTNAYGAWIAPMVDEDGDYSSIAVDSQGGVHLVYSYSFSIGPTVGSGIRYARTK